MAMSGSVRRGQMPVLCNLCDTNSKISWKCIDCNLLLCNSCKEGRHTRIKNAKNHKVLDIKEIGSQPAEPDFSSIQCTEHGGQVCVMFCKSCFQLVCSQCILKIHNGHQFVEISEGYKIQIQKLKDEQKKIKIKSLVEEENHIKEIKKAENAKCSEAKKKIEAQNISLKKSVDQHTEDLLKEVDQRLKTFSSSIEKEESRINALKKHSTSSNTQLDDIINSNNAEKIFRMSTKDLEKTLPDSPELNFTSMPIFLPGEITQNNVGSLQNTAGIAISVVQKYTTDISEIYNISPCVDSLWISNAEVVQKVQPEVNNLKVISSIDIKVYDMAVTPSNDLLLVCQGSVIKQISGSTGQLQDSIYHTEQLQPTAIHVTSDYKVLVGVRSFGKAFPVTGRRAVVSMDQEGKHTTTYEHDKHNKSIFSYPRRITSTNNKNIFVIDMLSSDDRGRVVVLGLEGEVINIYTGHPTINTATKPFKPVYIKTTPGDNVIVTDTETDVLNILNNKGHLITHIKSSDIGIQCPYSIAFTGKEKAYIGCTRYEGSTAMAKLYEVKITEY